MSLPLPVPDVILVQVPFCIAKRGGRKEMVMPVGALAKRTQPECTLIKALARAFRWQRMWESGEFATIGDLAAHEKIASSYMTRIMRLTLLAPNVVEGILVGRIVQGLPAMLGPFPRQWAAQAAVLTRYESSEVFLGDQQLDERTSH
jgi:hypothetical protein